VVCAVQRVARRDEAGRASAGADGGGQESGAAGGIPQARDGELESLLGKPLWRELEELLGRPLALFGGSQGEGDAQAGGPSGELTELHWHFQDSPWRGGRKTRKSRGEGEEGQADPEGAASCPTPAEPERCRNAIHRGDAEAQR